MSKKDEQKNKVKFDERGGPFGVGETVEEINKLNIFEFLQETAAFKEVTKDLQDVEKSEVLKEAKIQSEKYQKVLDHFKTILSTPEGKKRFKELAKKKMGGR